MKKFLKEAAEKILNNEHFGEQTVVILPNRRSEVFLKEEIKNISTKSIWLPEFYPVNEFIEKASGIKKADNISMYFELFDIHKEIGGDDVKTIDEFLTWAPVMLTDFNDIDNSMADANKVFKQLSAVKAIQQWNPDGRPLTQLQNNYLHFYNTLINYYTKLQTRMIAMNSGYQGFITRNLADNIPAKLTGRNWNNFILVGINALSEAEIKVFDYINQNFNCDFIWDIDQYYFSEIESENNTHEAGENIRNIIKRLKIKEPDNIGNHLVSSAKEIRILGVPKQIGQAKFVGQELKEQFESNNNQSIEGNPVSLMDTAIVLADEGLLLPLINSLPSPNSDNNQAASYNLTLGYPLNNTPVAHFFTAWIDLMISRSLNNGRILSTDLMSLFSNPIIKQLNSNNIGEKLTNHIITHNISTINIDELKVLVSGKDSSVSQIIFQLLSNDNIASVSSGLENLIDFLYYVISQNKINILAKEQVQLLIKILSKLILIISQNNEIINFKAVKQIVRQLINQSNISLLGEPLVGIQIMGMLETRTLDFKNVYILSANEGILPKANNEISFIPMDIRRQHKLPLPNDNSNIYAYHFFRLLQRAKNITLIYNSNSDKLGSGEKSRFILQIENELSKINPLIKLHHHLINTDVSPKEDFNVGSKKITIDKTEQIKLRLAELLTTGYSPSILSNYISCPLKFYFSNILEINTTSKFEKTVEANTFGTVIHAVLEKMYKPMENNEINSDVLKGYISNIQHLLLKQFKKYYSNSELKFGKNLLIFEVASNYIYNFLQWDINNIKKNPSVLQSAENRYYTSINHKGSDINFKGFIDRIDKRQSDGTIQIIDYKTGKVLQKELIVKDIAELTTNPDYAKAFQVMFYAWLYNCQNPVEKLEAGIISIRSISGGFITLQIKDINNIQDNFEEFQDHVINLISEISDSNTPFIQTEDTNQCTWCDFKSICNR